MVWFKVDDSFHSHPKVRRLGKDRMAALGLWTTCGSWCGQNGTDGFVPRRVVLQWDTRCRLAMRLVDVGLWVPADAEGESGWAFHEWSEYQPTRADVEAERQKWRDRKAKQRDKSRGESTRESRRTGTNGHGGTHGAPVPGPVPSSGHLGRGEPGRERAEIQDPPAPRCPKHIDEPADGPCGKCADARRAREAWETDDAARREHIARDIEAAIADPRERCGHGTDGGLFEHPVTGQSATCALCRAEQGGRSSA